MRIYLFLAAAAILLVFRPAEAAPPEGHRYTYNYWAGGYLSSSPKKPAPSSTVTVELSGDRVRAESPSEIFIINTRNGELLYASIAGKTFGYAQLQAYMGHMRTTVSTASEIITQLPPEFRVLAEKQKAAKGIDPLLWVQTTRRGESGGVQCASVEGRIGAEPMQYICSDRKIAQPVMPSLAQLESMVVEGTGGQRITGIFGNFPWPLDFPFSSYGVPVIVEKSTGSGAGVRTYLELKSQEPMSPDANRFLPPAGYRQVDLFPAR